MQAPGERQPRPSPSASVLPTSCSRSRRIDSTRCPRISNGRTSQVRTHPYLAYGNARWAGCRLGLRAFIHRLCRLVATATAATATAAAEDQRHHDDDRDDNRGRDEQVSVGVSPIQVGHFDLHLEAGRRRFSTRRGQPQTGPACMMSARLWVVTCRAERDVRGDSA